MFGMGQLTHFPFNYNSGILVELKKSLQNLKTSSGPYLLSSALGRNLQFMGDNGKLSLIHRVVCHLDKDRGLCLLLPGPLKEACGWTLSLRYVTVSNPNCLS